MRDVSKLPTTMRLTMSRLYTTYDSMLDEALQRNGSSRKNVYQLLRVAMIDMYANAKAQADDNHPNAGWEKDREAAARMFATTALTDLMHEVLEGLQ